MGRSRSTTTWVVLGLLIEKPSYGYEVGTRFQRRLGDLLPFTMPGVYAAIDRLERDADIVVMRAAAGNGERQPKPEYRATAQGARSYGSWMVASLMEETRATDVLARLGATAVHDPAFMSTVLDRYEELCLRGAAAQGLDAGPPVSGDSPQALMERLMAQHRRMVAEGVLPWVQYARAEIAKYNGRHDADQSA